MKNLVGVIVGGDRGGSIAAAACATGGGGGASVCVDAWCVARRPRSSQRPRSSHRSPLRVRPQSCQRSCQRSALRVSRQARPATSHNPMKASTKTAQNDQLSLQSRSWVVATAGSIIAAITRRGGKFEGEARLSRLRGAHFVSGNHPPVPGCLTAWENDVYGGGGSPQM